MTISLIAITNAHLSYLRRSDLHNHGDMASSWCGFNMTGFGRCVDQPRDVTT